MTPKSARDEIGGIERDAGGGMVLKMRLRAPPQVGEANEALGIGANAVWIEAGASGRMATPEIWPPVWPAWPRL